MPRSNFTVEIDLRGNAKQVKKAMKQAGQASNKLKGKINKNNKSISSSLRGLAIGFAALSGIKQIVTDVREFNKTIGELSTLGIDDTKIKQYSDSARKLAKSFGTDSALQVKAYYQAVSAGATTFADAQAVLEGANKLALGGVTDIETATDGLTTVLNAYGLETKDIDKVSDIFFNTMKAGKTTVDELSRSIGKVAPLAAAAGVDFESTGAAIATITASGLKTTEAVSGLKAAFANIIKPAEQANKLADELGIAFNSQALEAEGLVPFLQKITKVTGGNVDMMSALFGSIEGVNAVLALTRGGGEKFANVLEDIQNGAGATDKAVAKMKKTLDFRLNQVSAQFKDLSITLGQSLAPVFEKMIPIVIELATSFGEFAKEHPTISALAIALGAVAASVALIGGPVTLVIGVIAGLVTVWKNWDKILGFFQEKWDKFSKAFPNTSKAISQAFSSIKNAVLGGIQVWKDFFNIFTGEGKFVDRLKQFFTGFASFFVNTFKAPVNMIIGLLEKGLNGVLSGIPDILLPASIEGGITLPRLASGGFVSGDGSGTSDSIPAMLSDGEFVINAKSTKRHKRLLESLNKNKFQTGGQVGTAGGSNISSFFNTGGGFNVEEAQKWADSLNLSSQGLASVTNRINTIYREIDKGSGLQDKAVQRQLDGINKLVESSKKLVKVVDTGFFTNEEEEGIAKAISRSISGAIRGGSFKDIGTTILTKFRDIFLAKGEESLEKFLTPIIDSISNTIGNALSGIGGGGSGGGFDLGGIFSGVGDWFGGLFGATGGTVTNSGIKPFSPQYFAEGGLVRGTDTVPAMLTPGEIVLNKEQQGMLGNVTNVTENYNFDITATDAQSFKNMMAQDPAFLSRIAEQGKRSTTGIRRTR